MIYIVSLKDMNKDMRKEAQRRLFSYGVKNRAWEMDGCEMLPVSDVMSAVATDEEKTPVIEKNEHGKPYVSGNPWYFNVSHSGDYLAIVFSQNECGIDIQKRKEVKNFVRMCGKFSAAEERTCLDVGECAFFDIWASKEAYGKCLGVGLTDEVLREYTWNGKKGFVFKQNPMWVDGYSLCVCYREV